MLVPKKICDSLSDLEVIQKSLAEVDYFSCLYIRYEKKLLRYIRRLTSIDENEAEDILQESFIKIWKNLHGFDQSLKLSSWLYRIVHNQTISHFRKKRSFGKNKKVEQPEAYFEKIPDSTILELHEEGFNPELFTQNILQKIPAEYREILILKFLEGMSYREISDVLKIPEGTVATRINRAKKAFKKISKETHVAF